MTTKKNARRLQTTKAPEALAPSTPATGFVADTRYPVGDKVVSLVTAQRLEAGRTYTVEAVSRHRTVVGVLTVVTVSDGACTVDVVNPHLVLRAESADSARGRVMVRPPVEAAATKWVSQGSSQYGTPQPQVELRVRAGLGHRVLKAALYRLAAELELTTPAGEHWCVQVEPYQDEVGRVYLELSEGTHHETGRAMAFLRQTVG